MTSLFVVRESTDTEPTDEIGKVVDFGVSNMNPLVDKSSILGCFTEKARVWGKAGHYSC